MANVLAGQVAIVTGSGRGFGRAIAQHLASAGAAVCATSRTSGEIDETVASITAAGGKAIAVAADVTSRDDVARVVRETRSALGPVSILVHNAGVPWPFGPTWEVDPDVWWQAQEVHVRAAMYYINAVVPGMIERRNGRVIVVSSSASQAARPNLSGYAVAKATQNRLVEHLALEGKPHGVYAWSLHPGSVFTGISIETINDPAAQKYLPQFVQRLHTQRATEDGSIGLNRCGQTCVELASGRCDALSGRYLDPSWDLGAMVKEASATTP